VNNEPGTGKIITFVFRMKNFTVEVRSRFPGWDRYVVYMTAVCFGADGEVVGYVNLTDKGGVLETPPCESADLYLYVIAREFPASGAIADSPPFEIEVVVTSDGSAPRVTTVDVNQWGGLSARLKL
jgi:hypothetical protein